jgi:hypothetical protein
MSDRNGQSQNPHEKRLRYLYGVFGGIGFLVLPYLFFSSTTGDRVNFWLQLFLIIVIGLGIGVQKIQKLLNKKDRTSANDE